VLYDWAFINRWNWLTVGDDPIKDTDRIPDHFSTSHTTLFAIKGSNNKKTNKTKKKKRNKPLQDKSNTTGQHDSILGLIFSTQSTNDIIGYGELAQKIRFSITYAH